MFHRHEIKTRPGQSKALQDLIAVATPKSLLAEKKRISLVQKIQESSTLDASRFDELCLKLLHQFSNHCQLLPETANSYYALPGGLLDHALNRTEAALHLFRQQMVQGESAELSEEQKLWLYALFSAALLQGIGKLQLDYHIELHDTNGVFSKVWNPLLEDFSGNTKYYHYEFAQGSEDDLRCRLNLILAYQFMPKAGFAWIASNPDVLAAWLALINEDPNSAGMLGLIFERAEAIAIQRELTVFLIRQTSSTGGRPNRVSTFIDTLPESTHEKELALGAEFIKWLNQELTKGRFCVNKIPVMMLPAGIHLSPEVYQWFMRDHPDVKHWQAVQKGLFALGLHHRNPHAREGFTLHKYSVALPDKVHVVDPVSGQEKIVSAIEIMRTQQSPANPEPLHQLNPSGQWQEIESSSAELQTGFTRRE